MQYSYSIFYLKNRSRFNVFAFLIRLANKRPYNHVEVVAIPEMGSKLPTRFYGSVWPMSRLTNGEHINEKYKLIKVQPLKNFKNYTDEENLKWLESMCGKQYSASQVVLQLLQALARVLKNASKKVSLNGDQELICVELALRFAVERMGYVTDEQFDAGQFVDLENVKEPFQ